MYLASPVGTVLSGGPSCADDTDLKAESEEELKSLLMRVKEDNKKAGLKVYIQEKRSWHPVPSLRGK